MVHSWRAYNIAQTITDSLLNAKCIDIKNRDKARGIIQIILEEEFTFEQ